FFGCCQRVRMRGSMTGATRSASMLPMMMASAEVSVTPMMMAFPALLLAIVLAALLKPSLWIVAMVIALVNWVQVARIVYTE
ncbi:hypothetical protein ACC870_38105, partial [Rhizobium ruizarguesonis]